MTQIEDVHVLPADMRAGATGELFDALKAGRGAPVTLDASAVERMDTLSAQLFAIAATSWKNDDQPFRIIHPSQKVLSTLARLGLQNIVQIEGDEHAN